MISPLKILNPLSKNAESQTFICTVTSGSGLVW